MVLIVGGSKQKKSRSFRTCLSFGLFLLVTWLAEQLEHVLLVDLDTRLIEGVDLIEVSRHRAGAFEEVEEVAEVVGVHLLELEDDVVVLSNFGVGRQGAFKGTVLDVAEAAAFEIV